MAKAKPTIKATFCFSKIIPRKIANAPKATVAYFDIRISFSSVTAFPKALEYKSCEMADAPAKVKPETTAKIVANATAEIKPNKRSPPTA